MMEKINTDYKQRTRKIQAKLFKMHNRALKGVVSYFSRSFVELQRGLVQCRD